jgi:hypothetical protein
MTRCGMDWMDKSLQWNPAHGERFRDQKNEEEE